MPNVSVDESQQIQSSKNLEQLEMFKHGFPARDDVPPETTAKVQTVIQNRRRIAVCSMKHDELLEKAKENFVKFLEDQGLVVDYKTPTGKHKICFKMDKVINPVQFCNGVLRNEAQARLGIWVNKNKAQLDLFLMYKYDVGGNIRSPNTIEAIRLGKR